MVFQLTIVLFSVEHDLTRESAKVKHSSLTNQGGADLFAMETIIDAILVNTPNILSVLTLWEMCQILNENQPLRTQIFLPEVINMLFTYLTTD